MEAAQSKSRGVVSELGLVLSKDGEALIGKAKATKEMNIPGTNILRISVVAVWADTILGLLALNTIAPNVPSTVALDVNLLEPIKSNQELSFRGYVVKSGRTINEFCVDFTDSTGQVVAYAHSLFMATPDPKYQLPKGDWAIKGMSEPYPCLTIPYAERVGCELSKAGCTLLPWREDSRNASNSIHGGVLVLAMEEAVLSLLPGGQSLASFAVTYQRPIRKGPAVANAKIDTGFANIEVYEEGEEKLAARATARLF